ncbi:alpha/beta hydrolase [Niallia sp. Krafla_26]|uniref:alpha/beta hydrolase n=1 Tax=Niallia sp. Krafla_26 TaxID=3064703 RepID=UPI003D1630EF
MKKKKVIQLSLSAALFLSSIGIYATNRLMYMKTKNDDVIIRREKNAGRMNPDEFNALKKRKVTISSPFGYCIKMIIVEPLVTNRYIIISHGVTENKLSSIKYVKFFLDRGFNVLMYDHRRHGESGGKTTSYGYYEKYDLQAIVRWLKQEVGQDLLLGIHGESMGAATLLLYAGMLEDGADFYIADCPFSDLKELVTYVIKKEVKLPPNLVLPVSNFFLRLRDRYTLQDISPISVIDKIKKPILFIHTKQDDFILPSMTEELFKRKKGPKQLFLAENGFHACSYNENKESYEATVDDFLNRYVFNTIEQQAN